MEFQKQLKHFRKEEDRLPHTGCRQKLQKSQVRYQPLLFFLHLCILHNDLTPSFDCFRILRLPHGLSCPVIQSKILHNKAGKINRFIQPLLHIWSCKFNRKLHKKFPSHRSRIHSAACTPIRVNLNKDCLSVHALWHPRYCESEQAASVELGIVINRSHI